LEGIKYKTAAWRARGEEFLDGKEQEEGDLLTENQAVGVVRV
jgi:hypothetical protein